MHTVIRRTRHSFVVLAMLVGLVPLAAFTAVTSATTVPAVAAGPGSITLHVQAARSVGSAPGLVHKSDPVTSYKWIINQDDTGDPGTSKNPGTENCLPKKDATGHNTNPGFADSCQWPSIRNTSGLAPIVAQGDQTDLNDTKALNNLPAGKYLISVTADGFKIDGEHFTVDGGTQKVTVEMNPTPLPLTTLRIQVFNDNVPVDSTYEIGAENPLKGFTAHLSDVFGTVSVDYYGNALCTHYMRVRPNGLQTTNENSGLPVAFKDGKPVINTGAAPGCTSGNDGQIMIPNMGPDRYAATVAPPAPTAGQTYQWVQTTTLEGGRDWDIWAQEGETGYDNEVTKGAELVPMVNFGFVKTQAIKAPARGPLPSGEVTGRVIAGLPYIGGTPNGAVDGVQFPLTKNGGPVKQPWVALSDLAGGDAAIYVGRGNVDGTFDIKNVPDGTYQLSLWDDDIDYILYSFNVEVHGSDPNPVTDVGNQAITGWFTHLHGHVFIDSNENGRRDPGENSVPQFPLTVRERDNSLMDQAVNTTSTDSNGAYDIREAYPLGKWLVLEAFDTRYQTTGITYKGENENAWTTKRGALVDLNFLPIIGIGGEVDWGVKPFDPGTNGGIAGTISYDTTRNELDPADAASESYQPGIPNVKVHLYASVPCKVTDPVAVANECRQGKEIVPLNSSDAHRGALVKGPELADSYTSETWKPTRGCTAYDYKGDVLTDQRALPDFGEDPNDPNASQMCLEAPMMGVAIGPSDKTPENASQTVNGNYAFATTNLNQYPATDPKSGGLDQYAPLPTGQTQPLRPGDYIVSVDIPNDPVDGKPMYKVTSESDVNVFDGDSYLPQDNMNSITPAVVSDPPGPPTPKVDPPSQPPSQQAGIISPCAGDLKTVDVTDQPFLDGGGSPFQGQDRPSCTDKIVTVRTGQTVAPNFNMFTDVPIPTHFWGLTLNDLGLTFDKRSVNYGEAQGIPFVPVGLYDYAGRLVDTVHTDFNGLYEALEPSTDTYNCPVPAGPCPNMYRFVGNDPGQPGHLNSDYNSRFRTIAATFQGWPGLFTVTDEAPTQVANVVTTPDTTQADPAQCDLGANFPQLFAVDRPYVRQNTASDNRTVTLKGQYFGNTKGTITLGSSTTPLPNAAVTSWSDSSITFTVPTDSALGAQQISIKKSGTGLTSVNSLTLQVLDANTGTQGGSVNNPMIAEVGPGHAYATVQAGLEAARPTTAKPYWLVVVYPNKQDPTNPRGEYTENVILHHKVKLQGVGPGGFTGSTSDTFVPGSIIDGLGFNPDNQQGADWLTLLGGLTYSGDPQVPDAAVVTVLDDPRGPNKGYDPAIDGFTLTGGVQQNTATNVNVITGGVKTPYGATGALVTQGGGVFVHNNVANMQITDNVITGNGGSYGGGIRIGTPYVTNNRNTKPVISRNQIRDNGGTNLAGGIGIFAGSDGYTVSNNAICGNHSAEYGGAMTAFGYQGNSATNSISHNRIWFNGSYDEGGGIMIAGELPSSPTQLSPGTGPVSIDHNTISTNIANDDGGGIRLLQTSGTHVQKLGGPNTDTGRANRGTISITDNNVVDNISAHEGGGIALDDAAFVEITGNTVAKNLTTATAVTSDGQRAPAGLSTASNSAPLMSKLRSVFGNPVPTFSRPTLLDDIFWDNRAGTYLGGVVQGLGVLPDGTDSGIENWDMGMTDTPAGLLAPVNSVLQTTEGTTPSNTNKTTDPLLKDPYSVSVDVLASRTYPAFRVAAIVANILPPDLMGDYHLTTGSSARGTGANTTTDSMGPLAFTVSAPTDDIDNEPRPTGGKWDAGSDQMP